MDTKILDTTKENIEEAARIIRQGGLVAFPTETVYGLGADALNAEAVGKIYEAKGRPSDNPMIVHISRASDIGQLTRYITQDMITLIDHFWPGPLTLVIKKKEIVPLRTTGGLDTVAVHAGSSGGFGVNQTCRGAHCSPQCQPFRQTQPHKSRSCA